MTGSETRELNVVFGKSGTGSECAKICIPTTWLHCMDISSDNRKVFVTMDYDLNTILIRRI